MASTLVLCPALRLLGRCLLHVNQVRADLLAGALASAEVGARSFHVAATAARETGLLAASCDEVLVDVLGLEGLLAAAMLLLDRCADGEWLHDRVTYDVCLVEEARVAYHAGRVLALCVVLLLIVSVGACRPTPWLAPDDEVLRGRRSSAASQMHIGAVREAIAAALVVEGSVLRLGRMNGIGAVLRIRVKLQLAWQGHATERHLLASRMASVRCALVAARTIGCIVVKIN